MVLPRQIVSSLQSQAGRRYRCSQQMKRPPVLSPVPMVSISSSKFVELRDVQPNYPCLWNGHYEAISTKNSVSLFIIQNTHRLAGIAVGVWHVKERLIVVSVYSFG